MSNRKKKDSKRKSERYSHSNFPILSMLKKLLFYQTVL